MKPGRQRVRIFAGPTIPRRQIATGLEGANAEVEVSPPVRQGDLLCLLHDPPGVVGLIDGYFFQVPAVLHKEILLLLDRGVAVLGGASLGALRAAELDAFGMEGVGVVYRWYRDGVIDGDDEVAIAHASQEEGFRRLSDSLVDLRCNLEAAREKHLVSAATASRVLDAARRVHFSRRHVEDVLTAARRDGAEADEIAAFEAFWSADAHDLKLADARALLVRIRKRLQGHREAPPQPAAAVPETVPGTKFLHLHRHAYAGRTVAGRHLPDSWVLALHKLLSARVPAVVRQVRQRCWTVDEALHQSLERAPDDELRQRFRDIQGLDSQAAYLAWLAARAMTEAELTAVLRERDLERRWWRSQGRGKEPAGREPLERLRLAVARRLGVAPEHLTPLCQAPGIPWDEPLKRELQLRGEWPAALERAHRIDEHRERLATRVPHLAQALSEARLESWIAARWRVPRERLREVWERRSFSDRRELLEAARPAYLYFELTGRRGPLDQSTENDCSSTGTMVSKS